MSTGLGSNQPLGTGWKNSYNQYVETARTVTADSNKYGSGRLKGKVLSNNYAQDVFTKLGANIEAAPEKEIVLTGKNLSKKQLAELQKNAPPKAVSEFKNAANKGWTLNNTSVKISSGDYDTFVKTAASSKLDDIGIAATKAEGGALRLSVNAPVTDAQKSILKKAGVSNEAIEKLSKTRSSVVKDLTHENFIKKVGKQEVSNLAKASGVTVEEITNYSIKAGSSNFAKKIGLQAATLYKKVAGKFGKEVTQEAIEKFGVTAGKSVGKVGALSARGAAGVPIAGILLMSALEIPNVISAFKNEGISGGVRQICKSTGNMSASVAGSVIGSAVGGFVGTLIPIPGATLAGMWIGEAVGGIVGYTVGEKLTNGLFGESNASAEVNNTTEANNGVSGFMTDMSFLTSQPVSGTVVKKGSELF